MKNKYLIQGKGYMNDTFDYSMLPNVSTNDVVLGQDCIEFYGTEDELDEFCKQIIDAGEQYFKIIGIHDIK